MSVVACCVYITPGQTAGVKNAHAHTNRVEELQKLLSVEVAANPSLPGELLHIHAPRLKIDAGFAAGVFDRRSERPPSRTTPFTYPA